MLPWLLSELSKEWRVVKDAPFALGLTALVAFGVAWVVINVLYARGDAIKIATIRYQEEQLKSYAAIPMNNISVVGSPTLSPPQHRLLELLIKYERHYAVTKLVIDTRHGNLFFDDKPGVGQDVNLVAELYGDDTPENERQFGALMEDLPLEYVRFYPEMRIGSPFVVGVTERGIEYLQKNRQ
jgi:hypothetical protein